MDRKESREENGLLGGHRKENRGGELQVFLGFDFELGDEELDFFAGGCPDVVAVPADGDLFSHDRGF